MIATLRQHHTILPQTNSFQWEIALIRGLLHCYATKLGKITGKLAPHRGISTATPCMIRIDPVGWIREPLSHSGNRMIDSAANWKVRKKICRARLHDDMGTCGNENQRRRGIYLARDKSTSNQGIYRILRSTNREPLSSNASIAPSAHNDYRTCKQSHSGHTG